MRLNIRGKLLLYTLVPVTAVFAMLFALGVTHVKAYVSEDARHLLVEHARHQASRLALVLSQVPLLAESLGDLILAESDQSQTLLYAHLIDGLRRTPIAKAAAIVLNEPPRSAMMRRGQASGREVPDGNFQPRPPGWQVVDDMLHFNRAVHRHGTRIGDTWVELAIADVYLEIERLRSPSASLFVSHQDGDVLRPVASTAQMTALASLIPRQKTNGQVHTVTVADTDAAYWMVSVELPGSPWLVTAVTPTETALRPARNEAALYATGLLLALFTTALIIGISTRQITRPLSTLDASVRRIAQGDFAVAPEVVSEDELGGLARAIRSMARHISDREQQLRNAQQVLEQRVAARTADLQQSNTWLIQQIEETRRTQEALRLANAAAQQANRAKSEFLSNMSHELRTPLHGVLGYTQILRRDTTTSRSQLESLEAIERCGQHLLTLINDILDLTRIEAGQMRVDMQPTDLPQLLEDVRMIVGQRAATKDLQLHLAVTPDLPPAILTDPVKLKQILLNLLGNAVKFSSAGSVTLAATLTGDGQLEFEVADTGVGIPPDKVNAIFDAFHQVRDGQAIDGTGLGLTINQRLIALLGGQPLQVDSTPGVGSRFSFRLPYRAAPAESLGGRRGAAQGETGRLRLAPGSACTVMVVDPLAENRDVVVALLRYTDCEVEAFADTGAAAQRLREKAFDLLLLDVRLPDPGAAAMVSELRQRAAFGAPKLLAVSAHVFPGTDRLALQAGFDAFLGKPFGEQQLLDRIGSLLGLRFEPRPSRPQAPPEPDTPAWPASLARDTAERIRSAIDLGDVGSLFQLAEELAADPLAPRADVDNMALMARLFDFDGLRQLCERLLGMDEGRRPA